MTNPEIAIDLRRIADALDRLAPLPPFPVDWLICPAYVWTSDNGQWRAKAIAALEAPDLSLLVGIEAQKDAVATNVERHAAGAAAHDMLLWGARGTGKSALVRAAIRAAQQKAPQRIALVQVTQDALAGVTALFDALRGVERRFLVYIDDLGFEDTDSTGPRLLRSWLEGGVEARPANVRLAVTSNRRAIVARSMGEQDDPINPRDVVDDRLALADRFGLSIGFHRVDQDAYLAIISGYAAELGLPWDANDAMNRADALEWAQRRGARSGRVAWQYINELAGRAGMDI